MHFSSKYCDEKCMRGSNDFDGPHSPACNTGSLRLNAALVETWGLFSLTCLPLHLYFTFSFSQPLMPGLLYFQGHLHTYRFCDNVWTFILTDASFKNEETTEQVGKVKIVACDSKLLGQ